MKLLYFLTLVSFLCSCSAKRLTGQTTAKQTSPAVADGILFLQVKVLKKAGGYEAKIINRKQVPGTLSRDIRGIQLIETQWLVSFFDNKNKLLDQVIVPNPLEEHFETTDDQGNLKSVEVKKTEAEFFFRVQFNPLFTTIQFDQVLPGQKKQELFSLNLSN